MATSRNSSRYGTFNESCQSRRTELWPFDERNSRDRETVSEINLNYALEESHVHQQDWLTRNRLPLLYSSGLHWLSDKGNLGIIITLHIAIIGVFMLSLTTEHSEWKTLARYLLSCGMFGVAGGLSNWFALKILFIKVPGIYGSGVFSNSHQEIIKAFRRILMNTFLEQSFLEHYIEQKLGQHIVAFNIERQLRLILESETVEQIINKELHALSQSSEGQLLVMVGVRPSGLKPLIRPFIMDVATEVIPGLLDNLRESKEINASRIAQEVMLYLSQGHSRINAVQVNKFVRTLIYKHLNWLVITGCIVGFCMGVISQITSIARLI